MFLTTRLPRPLCLLMLIALLPLGSHAADYYVSPSGTDGASGGSSQPWKTLQYAANRARPGDVIRVLPGDYVGFVMGWDGPQNGTAEQPITFLGGPGVRITQRNSKTTDGINLEGASYITIDGFEINGMPRAGIRSVVNTGVVIRNNRCDQNGTWGIFTGFSNNLLIENNITSRSVTQHGIYVSNSCVNPVLRKNVSWGNYGCGIHMNGDLSMGAPGLISGALVEQNYIYENGTGGGSGINGDGVQNSVIRNNLIVNNHASGISLYRIDAAQGPKDDLVINNTIVQASNGRWALNLSSAAGPIRAFNNILYNYHSFRGAITVDAATLPQLISDYNAVINRFSANTGDTVMTLASWQALSGEDLHSFIAAPSELFVDAAQMNYELKTGSPAVDAGTAISSMPAKDFAGAPRLDGPAVDIGCYELQTTRPTPTPTPVVTPTPKPSVSPTPQPTGTVTPTPTRTPRGRKPRVKIVAPADFSTMTTGMLLAVRVSVKSAAAIKKVSCSIGAVTRVRRKPPYHLRFRSAGGSEQWQTLNCAAVDVNGNVGEAAPVSIRWSTAS